MQLFGFVIIKISFQSALELA